VWRRDEVRTAVLAVVDALCDGVGDLGIHGPDGWLPDGDPYRRR
ncbi:LysR family transcriptional regulator, partial [Streptomyces sp. MCAF7]